MTKITLSDILDDIQTAEQGLRKFERRYWVSSDQFYDLYSKGLLDDGENSEDFSEWAGHFKLRRKRLAILEKISSERIAAIRHGDTIELTPAEPAYPIAS